MKLNSFSFSCKVILLAASLAACGGDGGGSDQGASNINGAVSQSTQKSTNDVAFPTAGQNNTLVVRARADLARTKTGPIDYKQGAFMVLMADGKVVGNKEVRNTWFTDYTFTFTAPINSKLEVIYTNDLNVIKGGGDRNLFIESVTINGVKRLPTDPGVVFDRATADPATAFDGKDVLSGTGLLWWNGALRFPIINTPPITQAIYTDLESAPVGAFVTIYGLGTGNTASWPVQLQTADKTVVKVPANAATTPLVVGGKTFPVKIHTGRVIFATEANLAATIQNLQPGDTVYLRAGTYSGKYDAESYNASNFCLFKSGTAAQPIALVAYPGESVTIKSINEDDKRPNFHLGDGVRKASYLTIAGFKMEAFYSNIYGGGNTSDSSTPESGAANVRVIGNTFSITKDGNTGTGMVSLQGDAWKVIGNAFVNNPNREIINNNHGIYIQNGADNVEVAYNSLKGLRMGHVIQVHQDGDAMEYTGLHIHHNYLEGKNAGDMRGVVVSNVAKSSSAIIENNEFRNLGQDWSAIAVYNGNIKIRNNMMFGIKGPGVYVNSDIAGRMVLEITGNRFETIADYAAVITPSPNNLAALADIKVWSGNSYCGSAAIPSQDKTGTVCK